MSDQPDATDGYPLQEALKRFADPAKWRAYEQAARVAGGGRHRGFFSVGGVPTVGWDVAEEIRRNNTLVDQRDRAWRELRRDFLGRLRSGELVATGLEEPLKLDGHPRAIAPHLWEALRPNFRKSSAAGGGLKISGIRVRRAADADQERVAASGAAEEADHPSSDMLPEARPPGRPSMMPKIEAEMRRRAAAGQLHSTLSAESKVLARWAQTTHPDEDPPIAASIQRRLGRVYQELKKT